VISKYLLYYHLGVIYPIYSEVASFSKEEEVKNYSFLCSSKCMLRMHDNIGLRGLVGLELCHLFHTNSSVCVYRCAVQNVG